MKKSAAMLAGLSMLLFSQNSAAQRVTGYQINDPHISLFAIRKGNITKLKNGTNNLGDPIEFTCNGAAGCLVTVGYSGQSNTAPAFSVLVDGTAMLPGFGVTPAQSVPVVTGSHTIQLQAVGQHRTHLEFWEFRFVAYEFNN